MNSFKFPSTLFSNVNTCEIQIYLTVRYLSAPSRPLRAAPWERRPPERLHTGDLPEDVGRLRKALRPPARGHAGTGVPQRHSEAAGTQGPRARRPRTPVLHPRLPVPTG